MTLKTVAEFEIQYHQLLDPSGKPTGPLPPFAEDAQEMLKMYRLMTLVRVFDTKAVNLQRTGKLGTYASCLGHEATHVGVGAAMRPDDVLVPVYREYGAQFWRGVKMTNVLLYWGGDERGNDFTASRHDFAWAVPIGSQTLHAAGVAMAMKIRGEKRCALTFIGDGGTSQGAFYEALNLAGARSLPVVFVIVNNKWAISVPIEAQTATRTLAQKAIAAGIPGVQVDGNDVLAVYAVTKEALDRARRGEGPTLIEALTYRYGPHTTADDPTRYRPADELQEWQEKRDPIVRYRRFLESRGLWSEQDEEALQERLREQAAEVVRKAENHPKPDPTNMFDYMYAELPWNLKEQREALLQELAERGEAR